MGGPDDASSSSEMAGLQIKDGALRAEEGEVAGEDAGEGQEGADGQPSRYIHRCLLLRILCWSLKC